MAIRNQGTAKQTLGDPYSRHLVPISLFRRQYSYFLALLLCTAFATNLVSSAALHGNPPSLSLSTGKTAAPLLTRAVGNEYAGSDIYGIGVRVGFYLQGFTFTLNAFTKEMRKGTLLASSAVVVAVLASLSVRVAHQDISPAETLIVVDMLQFALLPGSLALLAAERGGQGLAIVLFTVDLLWNTSLLTWFWARGYRSLPLLGTDDAGFFYVRIDGWFRILSVVFTAASWP
jgi:hypothetical protein